RKAGTLERELASREKTLDEAVPDESSLRFLAIALAGDAMQLPAAGAGPVTQSQPISRRLIRAYERLYELHRDDLQLRQALQSLLERDGRVEEAAKLAAQPVAPTPMDCEAPPRVSDTLRGAA